MPVVHSQEIETKSPFPEVEMKAMVDRAHGSQAITMLSDTVHPGGEIPTHRHKVEGAMYVYAGTGYLTIEGEGTHRVEPGMGLLVPANTWHSMGNDSTVDLKFVTAHPAVDVGREMKEA
ncbi:MAG: cupin domain-containing protein [Chloroflexota bacterium]